MPQGNYEVTQFRIPDKYIHMVGNLREMIKYTEEFREKIGLKVEYALEQLIKVNEELKEWDEFLNIHILQRMKKVNKKKKRVLLREVKRLKRLIRKYKKRGQKRKVNKFRKQLKVLCLELVIL
jgi:uncharacterized protein YcbK (DUF882 family)